MPVAFGHKLVITRDGDMLSKHEEKIMDYNTVHSMTAYVESVKVKNEQQALAEFLTLLDRYKAGEISNPGIQLFCDPAGQVFRVEKSWIVPDLR